MTKIKNVDFFGQILVLQKISYLINPLESHFGPYLSEKNDFLGLLQCKRPSSPKGVSIGSVWRFRIPSFEPFRAFSLRGPRIDSRSRRTTFSLILSIFEILGSILSIFRPNPELWAPHRLIKRAKVGIFSSYHFERV